ncbi:MAG TPA: Cj0069 family protein [Caulobacteraceae bacterium]|nr:Cj0069 family protein [Caulobacteraceae bacterium]
MTTGSNPRVALLWRGDLAARAQANAPTGRLTPIFEALAREGVDAAPVVYCEEAAGEVREQLLGAAGVLVWVDPLSGGRDRGQLDPLLRDVAAQGVWVSAHPDVILKMGVKEVLYRTRDLGWGTDTQLYTSPPDFRARFPAQLASGPRVLKQNRGNGGQGVWKVERARSAAPSAEPLVEVLHAQRGSQIEQMRLSAFMDRCDGYFAGAGRLLDQPFQARLPDGMIRCYAVEGRVVGFGRQLIKALLPPDSGEPGPRIMSAADDPAFRTLRAKMEDDWIPAMIRRLQIDPADLPAIWDADFLFGPRTPDGEDTYVLCEINVSAVLPIPDQAPAEIARCVARRLAAQ